MFHLLTRQSAIQLTGKVISTAIGLWIVALMAHDLGAAGFGNYTTIVTFLQFAGILADLGLTMTCGRELGRNEMPRAQLMGNLLSFRTITAAVGFALAPLASFLLPYPAAIRLGISLTSLAFFLTSISQSLGTVFQVELKSAWLAASEIVGRLILLLGTWWVASMGLGLNAYLWALIAGSLATFLVTWRGVQKYAPHVWQIDLKIWQHLWYITWPVAVTIVLNLAYFRTDVIILSVLKSPYEVGLYGAAYKLLEVLLTVPAIVGGLVLPIAARLHASNSQAELKQIYQGAWDSLLGLGLATVIASLTIGVPLMVVLGGNEFAAAGLLLIPISLATAAAFAAGAAGYMIFALGLQRQVIPYYVVAAITALAGYFIFIPTYSYWGAGWVTAAINAFMAVATAWILAKRGFKLSLSRWPKILLATALLALGLMIPISLIGKLILGAILYLASLKYLKLIPPNLKQELSVDT